MWYDNYLCTIFPPNFDLVRSERSCSDSPKFYLYCVIYRNSKVSKNKRRLNPPGWNCGGWCCATTWGRAMARWSKWPLGSKDGTFEKLSRKCWLVYRYVKYKPIESNYIDLKIFTTDFTNLNIRSSRHISFFFGGLLRCIVHLAVLAVWEVSRRGVIGLRLFLQSLSWKSCEPFFFGGSHPSHFFPWKCMQTYIFFDAKILDFLLIVVPCCTELGRLHLPIFWMVVTSPKTRAHFPGSSQRCRQEHHVRHDVWRRMRDLMLFGGSMYICVWWKMDFCAKNQPLWASIFLKLTFCSKDFVSNLWFLSWFLWRSRRVQLFNLFWSHWHRSRSHHWTLFLQQLRLANPIPRFTTTSLSQHVHETTKRRNQIDNKKRQRKKTPSKNENLKISLFGHGFFQGRT